MIIFFDSSSLDSSIPPKGISAKQWEINKKETISKIDKYDQYYSFESQPKKERVRHNETPLPQNFKSKNNNEIEENNKSKEQNENKNISSPQNNGNNNLTPKKINREICRFNNIFDLYVQPEAPKSPENASKTSAQNNTKNPNKKKELQKEDDDSDDAKLQSKLKPIRKKPRKSKTKPKAKPKKKDSPEIRRKSDQIADNECVYGKLELPSGPSSGGASPNDSTDSLLYDEDVTISIEEEISITHKNPTFSGAGQKVANNVRSPFAVDADESSDSEDEIMLKFKKNVRYSTESDSDRNNERIEKKDNSTRKEGEVVVQNGINKEKKTEVKKRNVTKLAKNDTESETEFAFEKEEGGVNESRDLIASLTIVQARGLPSKCQRRDPYCVVSAKGSQNFKKTKVLRDTTSPIWNDKFKFLIKSNETVLVFAVKYQDKFGGDVDIGHGELSLKSFSVENKYERWIRLNPSNISLFSSSDDLSFNCELYISLFLEPKIVVSSYSQSPSPKSASLLYQEPPEFRETAKTPKVGNVTTFSSINDFYEGPLNMKLKIIEAKEIDPSRLCDSPISDIGYYCAVGLLGRRFSKKTTTVFNTSSPIWDMPFKFALSSKKEVITFQIRIEDPINGDYSVVRSNIHIDKIRLNSIMDSWISLHPLRKIKRMPVRNNGDEFLFERLVPENIKDIKNNTIINESAGKLHFSILLELPVNVPSSPNVRK